MVFSEVTLKKMLVAKGSPAALVRTDKVSLSEMCDFVVDIEGLTLEMVEKKLFDRED